MRMFARVVVIRVKAVSEPEKNALPMMHTTIPIISLRGTTLSDPSMLVISLVRCPALAA